MQYWHTSAVLTLSAAAVGACGGRTTTGEEATLSPRWPSLDSCSYRSLEVDAKGHVDCVIYVYDDADSTLCGCGEPGYLTTEMSFASVMALLGRSCTDCAGCVCELQQLEGEALEDCQNMTDVEWQRNYSATVPGWCYVDPAQGVGDERVVEHCSEGSQRLIRALGGYATDGVLLCYD